MELTSFYTIRFNDCDPNGHLNNSSYIDYMLNAREDHLKVYYQVTLPEFFKQGLGWVVRRHEIQYVRPAFYSERVCIESKLLELGQSHLLVEMAMYDEKKTALKAILWTNFTCIDVKTGRKQDHPASFMEFARAMYVHDINIQGGISERIQTIINPA